MTVCQNLFAHALLKLCLPGNLPGIFRKPSGNTVFLLLCCWDICWHASLCLHADLGVAVGGCSSGNLPEIFRKSSGISGDVQSQARLQQICGGALCVFALPGNLPGTFRKSSGTLRFFDVAISSGKSSGNLPETFRNHAFSNTSTYTRTRAFLIMNT